MYMGGTFCQMMISQFLHTFNVDFHGLMKSLIGASETPSPVVPGFFCISIECPVNHMPNRFIIINTNVPTCKPTHNFPY